MEILRNEKGEEETMTSIVESANNEVKNKIVIEDFELKDDDKISNLNFENLTVYVSDEYIIEAEEL